MFPPWSKPFIGIRAKCDANLVKTLKPPFQIPSSFVAPQPLFFVLVHKKMRLLLSTGEIFGKSLLQTLFEAKCLIYIDLMFCIFSGQRVESLDFPCF